MDDMSLADVDSQAGVDVSPELDPATFDVEAFLNGMLPARRAVRVYFKGHLAADMDRLADEIERCGDAAEREALSARAEALMAEFNAASVVVTVEARSAEAITARHKALAKMHGVTFTKAGTFEGPDDAVCQVVFGQLAEQIVAPKMTGDQLARLYKFAPYEVSKIQTAARAAGTQALDDATRQLTRDF